MFIVLATKTFIRSRDIIGAGYMHSAVYTLAQEIKMASQ